jgi:AcrR family transcriptional regulator
MIIESARSLIGSQGLSATTLRDVARVSDVALGTVTYHFDGIDAVLAGVLAEEMVAFSEPVTQAAIAASQGALGLDIIADGLLASDSRAAQHWRLWLDFWALAAHVPRYGAWQSEIYRDLHDLVADLMRRGQRDGSLVVFDPERQAVEFVALLDGLVVQSYLPDPRLRTEQARAILKEYARRR